MLFTIITKLLKFNKTVLLAGQMKVDGRARACRRPVPGSPRADRHEAPRLTDAIRTWRLPDRVDLAVERKGR